MIETASLLKVPARGCSDARPVPTANADWPRLMLGLGDAGIKSY